MVRMGSMDFWVLVMLGILGFVSGEVYIVIVEGDPVVTYRGGLEGYPATTVESTEDFDITRYNTVLLGCSFLFYFSRKMHT